MKKVVKIIGREHKSGISKKTNEPYELYVLHGTFKNENADGECAWSAVVASSYATRTNIGDEVVIESHFINGKEIIDSFLLPQWQ